MTVDGPDLRTQRPYRSAPALAVAFVLFAQFAFAQEPLFLRIRPIPEPGSAEAARAAREAVWARSEARARTAIASVCTGCLGAWRTPVAVVPAAGPARPDERLATLAAPTGLEPDPVSGASDTTTVQPIREERP